MAGMQVDILTQLSNRLYDSGRKLGEGVEVNEQNLLMEASSGFKQAQSPEMLRIPSRLLIRR